MSTTTFIYTIKDPIFNLVRYVGQTTQGHERFKQHLRLYNRKLPISKFIKKYVDLGKTPIFEVVEICSVENLNEREQFWIRHYKELVFNLLNLTDGGYGIQGYKHTELAKQKISEAGKGNKYKVGITAWNKNKPMGESTKIKCSLSAKRKKLICCETNTIYESVTEASLKLNISKSNISEVCRGIRKSADNLTFKYLAEAA